MYAYALFCDHPTCREFIYIPEQATTPYVAFQTIREHSFAQGWTTTTAPPQSFCANHAHRSPE